MNSTENFKGIVFSDFDGTLYNREKLIPEDNYKALAAAKNSGFITAVNTGRSLFSFRRVINKLDRNISDYFDYLVFSSGAGIADLRDWRLLEAENLGAESAIDAAGLLFRHGIDFMIQKEVPQNHCFVHVKSNGSVNPDYYRRIEIYRDFAEPLNSCNTGAEELSDLELIEKACYSGVSQLVAVIPPSSGDDLKYADELIEYLRHKLSGCTVIRTTSPIDHRSLWIEVFSPEVSKSKTAARLAASLNLGADRALAIGNDFNDEDLLHWAGTARTVDEAPEALKKLHISAGPSTEGAVAKAVYSFIAELSEGA